MPSAYTKKDGKDRKGNQRFRPDSKKYLYNIDTFWFNCDADNYDEVMDLGFREELRSAREHLLDTNETKKITIELDGYKEPLEFEVLPGQPPLYQYSIRSKDMAIYFSKNQRSDSMPMKVQINQFILWDKGLLDAYVESIRILTKLKFNPTGKKLNRVDFAVHSDQFKWNLQDLKTFDYPQNIAKDNKPNFYRLCPISGDFETVYYGDRTTCQLRIYNKSKEAKVKKKDYFLEMYEQKGMDKDNVWNVEVEVRRDFIKECKDVHGNPLFDDLDKVFEEKRLSLLWTHLMKMYSHDSAHWTQLSKGQDGVFEQCKGYLKRTKDNVSNAMREVAQVRGRLMHMVMNDDDYSLEKAINRFVELNKKYEEKTNKEWKKDVESKKKAFHDEEINNTVYDNKKLENDKKEKAIEIRKMKIKENIFKRRVYRPEDEKLDVYDFKNPEEYHEYLKVKMFEQLEKERENEKDALKKNVIGKSAIYQ